MPGLAEQKLIIHGLERATARNRVRLVEAFRTFDPPLDAAMIAAGTALIIADLAPGIVAIAGLFFGGRRSGKRRKRLYDVFLEAPVMVRSLRRLLP